MKYFTNCNTIEELKKEYKKLAFMHHPDRGGDAEIMKAINNEYELATELIKKNDKKAAAEADAAADFIDIINNLINLKGLIIEIVGNWIWVTGNTKEHKEELKKCGFYYASKKKAWYYKPADYVGKSRRHYSLNEIKSKYGSTTITGATQSSKDSSKEKSKEKKSSFKPRLV